MVLAKLVRGTSPPDRMPMLRGALKMVWILKCWAAVAREKLVGLPVAKQKNREKKQLTAKETLKNRLGILDLQMLEIAGDGNCQFRSASQQLFGNEAHHEFVRRRSVAFIRARANEFAPFFMPDARARKGTSPFDAYLSRMAKGRTWGDELTLRAICNAFGAVIHVVTSTEENWYLKYEPEVKQTEKQIFLAYISPAHYNAFALLPGSGSKRPAEDGTEGFAKRAAR